MEDSHKRNRKLNMMLVQIKLKISRDIYQSLIKLVKSFHVQILVLRTLRDKKSSQSRQGSKQEIFTKLSKIFAPKGITRQKLLKLIKAIMSKQKHHWRLSQTDPHHPYMQI